MWGGVAVLLGNVARVDLWSGLELIYDVDDDVGGPVLNIVCWRPRADDAVGGRLQVAPQCISVKHLWLQVCSSLDPGCGN
eukprot:1980676-Rhodomonas_salina.4